MKGVFFQALHKKTVDKDPSDMKHFQAIRCFRVLDSLDFLKNMKNSNGKSDFCFLFVNPT